MHNKSYHSLAIYGGAFDPVHLGHIQTALYICQHFHLHELYLLPCGQPVFKKKCLASPQARLEMLSLATKAYPHIKIDTRELLKSAPSYTIETLKDLRLENGSNRPILFILGQDAFYDFLKWHDWQNILNYCHLIILKRANFNTNYSEELQTFLCKYLTTDMQSLIGTPHGSIYEIYAGDYPYSSTNIKKALKEKEPPKGLDKEVLRYIHVNHLYGYSNDS